MKELTFFFLPGCPFCKKADEYLKELRVEFPQFASIKIHKIDEVAEAKLAKTYAYYYTPAFFLGRKNLFEGDPNKEDIIMVLNAVIDDK